MKPNFAEEKKLWKRGFAYVVGLDEAGRGPLAGPVVAAAVLIKSRQQQTEKLKFIRLFKGVNDSKKLSEKRREFFYAKLTNHKDIKFGVGIVSEKTIDQINILQSTKLAMRKAYSVILQNYRIDFLMIDGNFRIDSKIPQKSIIKGDQKVFSIAAASIIAKVTRDRLMQKMHKKFPQYDFARHKGYGTKVHIAKLAEFGPCKIHRKSFYPISVLSKQSLSDKIHTS